MGFYDHLKAINTYNKDDPYVKLYENLLKLTYFLPIDDETPYSPSLLAGILKNAINALKSMPNHGAYSSLKSDMGTLIAEHLSTYRVVFETQIDFAKGTIQQLQETVDEKKSPYERTIEELKELLSILDDFRIS